MKRIDFVKKVREALGTPYGHMGRKIRNEENPKGRLDCAGVLYWACKELGYDTEDVAVYKPTPDGIMFQSQIEKHMFQIKLRDAQAGDCLMMKFDKHPQHLAVITATEPYMMILHAYSEIGKVAEHRLDEVWGRRIVACYRFKDLEEEQEES